MDVTSERWTCQLEQNTTTTSTTAGGLTSSTYRSGPYKSGGRFERKSIAYIPPPKNDMPSRRLTDTPDPPPAAPMHSTRNKTSCCRPAAVYCLTETHSPPTCVLHSSTVSPTGKRHCQSFRRTGTQGCVRTRRSDE